MEKRKFYVSVNSGEIVEDPTITPWQFEIEATKEEVDKLRDLFDQASSQNMDRFYRLPHPFKGGEVDHELTNYDKTLQEVYRMIYDLGNQEAKDHIEQTDVISELGKNYDVGIGKNYEG